MHASRAHRLHLYPDEVLRRVCQPVERVDDGIRSFVDEMFQIMRDEGGIGLAAPQAGRSLRIFVTEAHEEAPPRVFINPTITALRGAVVESDEGCLSLPGIRVHVRRPPQASIAATDLDGAAFTLDHDGLLARCWQHELDHLDGKLIIDRMGPMDRLATRKALRALERGEVLDG